MTADELQIVHFIMLKGLAGILSGFLLWYVILKNL